MRRTLAVLTLSMLAHTAAAQAPSLTQRLGTTQAAARAEMQVACGKLDKANCAQVLPRIAEQVAGSVALTPIESEGSFESATGVCLGLVEAAIVQRDAADLRSRQADCAGKIDSVGRPLYPYYGFLVLRADAPYDTLDKLVRNTPEGKTLTIAVGADGSGGAVTMGYVLRADPEWKRVATTRNYGLETALQRLRDGSLDAFFVMDAPGSPLIDQIGSDKDAKGNRVFQFGDMRPNRAFYAIKDWSGRPMYQEAVVTPGTFRSTKSVSVDAGMIVGNGFREDRAKNGPKAVDALAAAIDRAQAAIYADTKTPRDWTPAAGQK